MERYWKRHLGKGILKRHLGKGILEKISRWVYILAAFAYLTFSIGVNGVVYLSTIYKPFLVGDFRDFFYTATLAWLLEWRIRLGLQ